MVAKQYKSREAYRADTERALAEGWEIQDVTTTTSRRAIGCLFGLIGYWLLPRRTVYHVTYVYPFDDEATDP